jgi:hypothetical protein
VGALIWPAVSARRGWRTAAGWTAALTAFPAALAGAMPNYSQVGAAFDACACCNKQTNNCV